jgi:adenylate kinase family enzyme
MTTSLATAPKPSSANMPEMLCRTLIIGNAGSGKSTLAEHLAALKAAPSIDLDRLHWEAGPYGVKRDKDAARQLARTAAHGPRWIIEGAFGWLAEIAVPRATTLIWLDLSWDACRAGVLARGLRRGSTEDDLKELLKWVEAYWDRQTSSSFIGHLTIFENFPGAKHRLGTREKVSAFLADHRTQ